MPIISTEGGVFTLGYEAPDENGDHAHFQSCYRPGGQAVFERRRDSRTEKEIYEDWFASAPTAPPSNDRERIYKTAEFPSCLVFVDKLAVEESIFLNWRLSPANHYTRIALDGAAFYRLPPHLIPCISKPILHQDCLAIAWIREAGKSHELVLTQVSATDPKRRRDQVLAEQVPYTTDMLVANIGAEVVILCVRGFGGKPEHCPEIYFARLDCAS